MEKGGLNYETRATSYKRVKRVEIRFLFLNRKMNSFQRIGSNINNYKSKKAVK